MHAGDLRVDGAEGAAVFGRGEGLGIEGFLVRDAAGEENVDDALGDGFVRAVSFRGSCGACAEKLREGKPDAAEQSDVEKLAA